MSALLSYRVIRADVLSLPLYHKVRPLFEPCTHSHHFLGPCILGPHATTYGCGLLSSPFPTDCILHFRKPRLINEQCSFVQPYTPSTSIESPLPIGASVNISAVYYPPDLFLFTPQPYSNTSITSASQFTSSTRYATFIGASTTVALC